MSSYDIASELAQRYQQGDQEAGEQLVKQYTRLIAKNAHDTRKQMPVSLNTQFEDLVAEFTFALLRAAKQYDASRGVKFITYATTFLYRHGCTIRTNTNRDKAKANNTAVSYNNVLVGEHSSGTKTFSDKDSCDLVDYLQKSTEIEITDDILCETLLTHLNKTEIIYVLLKKQNYTSTELREALGVTHARLDMIKRNILTKSKKIEGSS